MTYTKFYSIAYQFLLAHLPTSITEASLQRYFIPERNGFSSIADVFEGFIESAQTQQMLPNVIKFRERHKQIKKIFATSMLLVSSRLGTQIHSIKNSVGNST